MKRPRQGFNVDHRSCDNLGRLLRATDGNGHFPAFGYDALGRKVTEDSNCITRSFGYDPAGRATRR